MLKFRLIPVLLLENGFLVRSEIFKIHQIIGNPINEVKRFNEWNVDELIYLDISGDDNYDQRRSDHKEPVLNDPLKILEEVSKTCFMPLTWGGRIRTIDDMKVRFKYGADKITINTAAVRNPALITEAAQKFGNQAIVVSIDAFRHPDNRHEVFIDGGRTPTGMTPEEWAKKAELL
jgi:imidazole glycerol-phosphate synthase subunit HisF